MYDNLSMGLLEMLQNMLVSTNILGNSLGIVAYILEALALYTIAKRRGIKKPWLAWIPVGNVWILGSLADQYRYVKKREVKNRRKWMLGLELATALTAVLAIVGVVWSVMDYVITGGFVVESLSDVIGTLISIAGMAVLWLLPALVLGIATMVLRWMCIYDVLRSCDPANHKVYFWVSLGVRFVGLNGLEAVFLMICMNRDEGMPPRRRETPAPGHVPPTEEPKAHQPEQNAPEF